MILLHTMAKSYGSLPSDVIGHDRGSWQAWIVNVCAQQVGDEAAAAMVHRTHAQPVVLIG